MSLHRARRNPYPGFPGLARCDAPLIRCRTGPQGEYRGQHTIDSGQVHAGELGEGITSEGTRRLCSLPYMEYPILLKCKRILLFLAAHSHQIRKRQQPPSHVIIWEYFKAHTNVETCWCGVRRHITLRAHTLHIPGLPPPPRARAGPGWHGPSASLHLDRKNTTVVFSRTHRSHRSLPLHPERGPRTRQTPRASCLHHPAHAIASRHAPLSLRGAVVAHPVPKLDGRTREITPPGAVCPRCRPTAWSRR